MSVEGGQPKKIKIKNKSKNKENANPIYKATKHIERSLLIFDYYLQVNVPCVPLHIQIVSAVPSNSNSVSRPPSSHIIRLKYNLCLDSFLK